MGPVAGASPVDFQLVLAPCTPGAAAQLARAVSTPGTAQYRHFLTASQWEARFSSSRRRTETQSGGPSQL
jgi:subtilase family serine protease